MSPELKFVITALNRASPELKQVGRDIETTAAKANIASTSLARFGNSSAVANRSLGQTRATLTNLSFQLNDVVTGLISGQAPMRILAQQGGQIVQAFQMGPGGVGGTFKALGGVLVKFAPLLIGIGAAAVVAATAIKALGDKVSEGHKKVLTFGQTIKGLAVTMWDAFSSQFGKLPDWVTTVWSTIENEVAHEVNSMIQDVATFGARVNFVMQNIPALVTKFLVSGVNVGIVALNNLTDAINEVSAAAGLSKPLTEEQRRESHIPTVGSSWADTSLDGAQKNLASQLAKIRGTNYLDQIYANGTAGDTVKKVTKHFSKQDEVLRQLTKTYDDAKGVFQGLFTSLADNLKQGQNVFQAFASAALDALGKVFDKMLDLATSNIFEMLFPAPTSDAGNWATTLFRSLGFANGGVFAGGGVQPFALGGVVTRPMLFPFANGTGLMGEAGPEAIMPLKRGPDGRLGVSAANANAPAAANSNVHVTVGVSVDQNGNLGAYVKNISRETTSAGIRSYDAGLPDRMMQIRRDPRLRR